MGIQSIAYNIQQQQQQQHPKKSRNMNVGESSESTLGPALGLGPTHSSPTATETERTPISKSKSKSTYMAMCDDDEATSINYTNTETTKLLPSSSSNNNINSSSTSRLSVYNSITSSDCKTNDDDSDSSHDDTDNDNISITVLEYATSLKDFCQPAIDRSSCLMKYLKQRDSQLHSNPPQQSADENTKPPRRVSTSSISPCTSSSSEQEEPVTPKRMNKGKRVRFLVPANKSKHSSVHVPPNRTRSTTSVYLIRGIIGLLVLLAASSSIWIMHSKKQSQMGPSYSQPPNPNPYYFWKLVYNNDDGDVSSPSQKHMGALFLKSIMTFFYNPSTDSPSLKTATSTTTSTKTNTNNYKPPTITSNKSFKSPSSKLVIAGKMTVQDEFCNIAELTLNDGVWNLKERIQLSLYNSYSGGEVYSLLVNHTFNRDYSIFDKGRGGGGNGINGNGMGLMNEEKSSKGHDHDVNSGGKRESHGNELIVVGAFDTTYRNSQTTYCSVGAWDGIDLSKVGEGLCNSALSKGMKITSAAMAGPDDVYVAGSFSTQVWNGLRHEFVHIYNIAHYNAVDKVWLPLPVGQISCSWCRVTVLALAYDSKRRQLHVAGKFNAIDGSNIPSGLAIYDLDTGHLVAHPGGGLTMHNATQDGVGTALQLDEEAGVLYVMGSYERMGTGQLCFGLAAFEIDTSTWTCLADAAHTVMPSGGGNMLLTPYGLMVAGRTTRSTTWPNSDRPYTIALLNTTVRESVPKKSSQKSENLSPPSHEYTWSWLPGFDGHDEPLHSLANGFSEYEGTVFISGDNLVAAWYYEEKTEVEKSANGVSETKTTLGPVTQHLSNDNVLGAVMAIAQLKPEDPKTSSDRRVVGNTLAVYLVALGTLIGMMLAFVCTVNRRIPLLFQQETQNYGLSLDTLTYSAINNADMNDIYQRAMKVRCVPNPHFLQLIDPQDIFLHRIIGEGTFGRVWSARLNSASVAVKEFVFAQAAVAGRSSHQNEIIEEIIGEAGMMAILRHPNVLQLFGCSLTAQAIWIVCELCSLGSLRQLLDDDERELPMKFRLKIALQVAEGLMYLHNQDPPIIHRDLKSHNIMVHETFTETTNRNEEELLVQRMSENARNAILSYQLDQATRTTRMNSEATVIAKIGDWGSARATLSGSRTMTHGVGTACWLAPEVIKHARCSKHSDVYSYGIILWELATREEVYAGLESTQIIASVANDNLRPTVPENNPFGPLMEKCWCIDPTERLTFKDIVKELNKLIDEIDCEDSMPDENENNIPPSEVKNPDSSSGD